MTNYHSYLKVKGVLGQNIATNHDSYHAPQLPYHTYTNLYVQLNLNALNLTLKLDS